MRKAIHKIKSKVTHHNCGHRRNDDAGCTCSSSYHGVVEHDNFPDNCPYGYTPRGE